MACFSRGICLWSRNSFSLTANNTLVNYAPGRFYSRGIRRRPVQVLLPEEIASQNNQSQVNITILPTPSNFTSKNSLANKPGTKELSEYSNLSKSAENKKQQLPKELHEKVQSDRKLNSRKLSDAMILIKSRKSRQRLGKILLEGDRLIKDALMAGAVAETIYFSRHESVARLPLEKVKGTELVEVNYKELQTWSELTTSPGIIGIFQIPDPEKMNFFSRGQLLPITVICDNIRDPGNLGTILRCAAGLGCEQIILTKGCVDAWDPKVLRSGAGAHFRLPINNSVEWELINNYMKEDSTVILADSSQNPSNQKDAETLHKLITARESELGRSEDVEVVEAGKKILKRNPSYSDEKLLNLYSKTKIPLLEYTKLQIKESKPLVLVIGGETHGLSGAAHKLACDYGGFKVFIPLANGVDSLNSGIAMGIIGYELRRKLL